KKGEQDGKVADDLVGHRLSFMGNRFEIRSKDDKPLYAGTVQMNPGAKPATIDFQQHKGALSGKAWKGIYAVDGDTLTTCDNAADLKKRRPAVFEAKTGTGHVLITLHSPKPLAHFAHSRHFARTIARLGMPASQNEIHRSADLPSPPSICRPISAMAR